MIDKSLPYRSGALAVCFVNEEFTLKGIKVEGNTIYLMPVNKDYYCNIVSTYVGGNTKKHCSY